MSIRKSMGDATALVREGRLHDATAAIRHALSGGDEAPSPREGAMRDVTPDAGPRPGAAAEPRAEPRARGRAAEPGRPFGAQPAGPRKPRIDLSALNGLQRGGPRVSVTLPEGARFEERRHRGAHGTLSCKLYLPAHRVANPPLVVMLHGCTQDPDDFALGTRMNAVAEETGALIAYPRQEASRNPSRCWSWFEPAQRGRSGEAALIAGLAAEIVAAEEADPSRVFAAGLSAGGAMAAALGASHGEVFAAVGVHSGLPVGAASDMQSAFGAMGGGGGPAQPIGARVIAFHGTGDRTVAPVNAERLALAGRPEGASDARVERGEANGRRFERMRLGATAEAGALELWRVEGLGHAWSGGCGDGTYTDPAGPDASREMMRFFLEG